MFVSHSFLLSCNTFAFVLGPQIEKKRFEHHLGLPFVTPQLRKALFGRFQMDLQVISHRWMEFQGFF
jgi:hypothetical protein